jgi:DNA-binding beta-propeller fold protein YncE
MKSFVTALLFTVVLVANGSLEAHPPTGIAVDAKGNVLFVDVVSNRVFKVTREGEISIVAEVSGFPHSLTIDANGNLFVGEYDGNRILRIKPDYGVSTLAIVDHPCAIAADHIGNLYVSSDRDNIIHKILPDGTVERLAEVDSPRGLAVDRHGNIFVASGSSRILKIAQSGSMSVVAEDLLMPWDVDVDDKGNLYVAEYEGGRVVKIALGRGVAIETVVRLEGPCGVALSEDGEVCTLSGWEKRIKEPRISVHRTSAQGLPVTLVGEQ